MQPRSMDDALRADFDRVSSARVYFGHQSVGGNIMDGLADLQGQLGQPVIRVGELGSLDVSGDHGVLLHTKVGKNEQPVSKCQDFQRILDQQLAGLVDVALFKFCYIDFNDTSDVDAIFQTYSRTMDDLKQRHPDITFIHVTAPLRSVDRGPGVWAREMLGRPNRVKLANVSRNEFNRRLKERYPADPIYRPRRGHVHLPGRPPGIVQDGREHLRQPGARVHGRWRSPECGGKNPRGRRVRSQHCRCVADPRYDRRGNRALDRSLAPDDDFDRLDQDREIEQQAAVLHVEQVVLQLLEGVLF